MLAQQRSSDMQWLQRLREAIDNDQLVLFGQSIFRRARQQSAPGDVRIARMVDGRGIVPPMTFIPPPNVQPDVRPRPLGDRCRIPPTGSAVAAPSAGPAHLHPSTCRAQSLDHPDLEAGDPSPGLDAKIEPHRICFEITETSVIGNMDRALALMDSLRRPRFPVRAGRFRHRPELFRLPEKAAGRLPQDRWRIRARHPADPVDKAMVDTIKRIGGVLKCRPIAEAIEDADTCALLTAPWGSTTAGYHLAKPAPAHCFAPAT